MDPNDTTITIRKEESGAVTALSLIGLILGSIALLGSVIPCLGVFALSLGVPAVICSVIGLYLARSKKVSQTLSIIGLIIGGISILISKPTVMTDSSSNTAKEKFSQLSNLRLSLSLVLGLLIFFLVGGTLGIFNTPQCSAVAHGLECSSCGLTAAVKQIITGNISLNTTIDKAALILCLAILISLIANITNYFLRKKLILIISWTALILPWCSGSIYYFNLTEKPFFSVIS